MLSAVWGIVNAARLELQVSTLGKKARWTSHSWGYYIIILMLYACNSSSSIQLNIFTVTVNVSVGQKMRANNVSHFYASNTRVIIQQRLTKKTRCVQEPQIVHCWCRKDTALCRYSSMTLNISASDWFNVIFVIHFCNILTDFSIVSAICGIISAPESTFCTRVALDTWKQNVTSEPLYTDMMPVSCLRRQEHHDTTTWSWAKKLRHSTWIGLSFIGKNASRETGVTFVLSGC